MVTNFEASQAPGATVGRPNSSHPTEPISPYSAPKNHCPRGERGYNAEMPTSTASGDFGVSREYRRLNQIAEKCILVFSATRAQGRFDSAGRKPGRRPGSLLL
jgi:hypothetical protein